MIVNKLMMIIDDFDLQSSRLAGNHWKRLTEPLKKVPTMILVDGK